VTSSRRPYADEPFITDTGLPDVRRRELASAGLRMEYV
jgi:hypothetical protein